jgi:hypothetical protein
LLKGIEDKGEEEEEDECHAEVFSRSKDKPWSTFLLKKLLASPPYK